MGPAVQLTDAALAERSAAFEARPAQEVIRWAADTFGSALCLTTSLTDARARRPGAQRRAEHRGRVPRHPVPLPRDAADAADGAGALPSQPHRPPSGHPARRPVEDGHGRVLRRAQGRPSWPRRSPARPRGCPDCGERTRRRAPRPRSSSATDAGWSRSTPSPRGPTSTSTPTCATTTCPSTPWWPGASRPWAAGPAPGQWPRARTRAPAAGPAPTRPNADCTCEHCEDGMTTIESPLDTLVIDRRSPRSSQLAALEAHAVFVLREVAAEFERPVLLFSGGKDSIVLLRLAEKAFRPGPFPFPIMHVDTGHNFPEAIDFRDRRVAELGERLIVASVQESIDTGRVADPGFGASRNRLQTTTLLDAHRPSTASTPPSAAPAATRTRPGPRSASCPSATRSGSGTPATSGPSSGTCTTAASSPASTCGRSRSPTGPSSTCGATSPPRSSRCRRSTSPTAARSSSATACCWAAAPWTPPRPGESRSSRRSATAPSAT